MIPKPDFQSIMDKMIPVLYAEEPNQLISYKLEKEDWINQLYSDDDIANRGHGTVLEGGSTIATVIEIITLLISVYKVVKELTGSRDSKPQVVHMAELQNKLKLRLYEEKVDEDTIDRVVNEFAEDILIKINQNIAS